MVIDYSRLQPDLRSFAFQIIPLFEGLLSKHIRVIIYLSVSTLSAFRDPAGKSILIKEIQTCIR